jgi:hypothetical protein
MSVNFKDAEEIAAKFTFNEASRLQVEGNFKQFII